MESGKHETGTEKGKRRVCTASRKRQRENYQWLLGHGTTIVTETRPPQHTVTFGHARLAQAWQISAALGGGEIVDVLAVADAGDGAADERAPAAWATNGKASGLPSRPHWRPWGQSQSVDGRLK